MKRVFDFTVALVLIVILSPFMLLTALVVYCAFGGPILFKQVRPGLHEKPFRIYKFRTMLSLHDAYGKERSDEERLTRTGILLRKFSLDELPQLINVIKGELSLVGPRPLLMEYLEIYDHEQRRRHEVRPGITGWAQVNGRNQLEWEDKLRLDVWYVDNHNLWLDLKILVLTFFKVIRSDGINQQGSATASKFQGTKKVKH